MKGATTALMAGGALLLSSGIGAQPIFEDGIPAGWTCEGSCGTSGADGVVTLAPGGGDAYGWIATTGDSAFDGVGALPGIDGAETDGSRLTSSVFAADAGDELDFQFNYVTSDGGTFVDYAWARLLDDSLNQIALLFTARTSPDEPVVPGFGMPDPEATMDPEEFFVIPGGPEWSPLGGSSGSCWSDGCGYTDWVNSQFVIEDAGNYVLQFGVTNWGDNAFQSGMAFDGITVGGEPPAPAPAPTPTPVSLPATGLLMGLGLVGLGWARRRGAC